MVKYEPELTLETLLAVENDAELLAMVCPETGIPAWAFVRGRFLRAIMSDRLYKSTPLVDFQRKRNHLAILRNVFRAIAFNLGNSAPRACDLIIQSSGAGAYCRDGQTHDRLIGGFAEVFPNKTLIYQDAPPASCFERYAYDHVRQKCAVNLYNKVYSRVAVSPQHKSLACAVIQKAKENAQIKLGYEFADKDIGALTAGLAFELAGFPNASEKYAKWLSKMGVRLMLKEDACYGGEHIAIIHGARRAGVVVAEYQHGAISKGHDAYNVAPQVAASAAYRKTLPDYLLTYGVWWSAQANVPVEKRVIGNPYLTETLKGYGGGNQKQDAILVLGDGVETGKYLSLASHLCGAAAQHGRQVVFRPHPLEREKLRCTELPMGVQLDVQSNVYRSLANSWLVISELSTGLFEAVGLADNILLWETEKSKFAFPDIPFDSFRSLDELNEKIVDFARGESSSPSIGQIELWNPRWKSSYEAFVLEILEA